MENEWGGEERIGKDGRKRSKKGGRRIREMGHRYTQEKCLVDD